jgi:hypothetical protein
MDKDDLGAASGVGFARREAAGDLLFIPPAVIPRVWA